VLRFRRPQLRYAATPPAVTPYQAAGQAWDDRIGAARVQARNWRLMSFGCLGLALLMAGALIWRTGQSSVTPYVVEVDSSGQLRAVGEAATPYRATDGQIAFHLARFIGNVRALATDPVVVRQSWLAAYDYTTAQGALLLNEYARAADPFGRVGQVSVAVEVSSVVRASDHSFQLRWVERTYTHGALAGTERWTAIVTLVMQPPRTEERLRRNPLGIYVNGLSWSRELGANSEGKGS
jgi:type IV secretory pathway TrbF-like protein